MPATSSLYELSSLVADAVTGRKAVVEALLAFGPDTVTLTMRVPGGSETFTLVLSSPQGSPIREAVARAYQGAPVR